MLTWVHRLLAEVPLTIEIRKGAEVIHTWPTYLVTAGTSKNLRYVLPTP